MEVIDAHQHFWYFNRATHGWIDDTMAVIRRDFLPQDLKPILRSNQVNGTIAVQADQSMAETRFLLNMAEQHDFIFGVVGWVDMRSKNLESQLDSLAGHKKLVGFRHIVQSEEDPLFLLKPDFLRGLEIIFERGYTYDLLIYPHQLPAALELIHLFPTSPIVIDHLAKPYIKAKYYKAWAALMKEIGLFPNVYCKWSGMITEADWNLWESADLKPYLDVTAGCFTAGRIMFGSDWPVLNLAGRYERVISVVREYISDWPVELQERVMGGNARRFYLSRKLA